ncbi:MAG: signal peptidase II [Planctomycetia bacterium]|nr:signal peptidase II [Planctomycetia bacterium]
MNGIAKRRFALFALIAVGGCTLDLWTKHVMFARLGLPGGEVDWIWPEYFGWQTALNEGALFGIGQGKVWLFAVLSLVAGTAILYWLFVAGAARDLLLTIALAAVMGGVLGNLYDRLGLWSEGIDSAYPRYAVRDWILLKYDHWIWPNFNIADMLLVGGAGLLMLHAWRSPSGSPSSPEAQTA